MTMQLYLSWGSTTVNFQTGGCAVLDGFFPQAAQDPAASVTDSFEILYYAATSAARIAFKQSIIRLLEAARNRRSTSRVYLCWSIDSSTVYKTEVLDGTVALNPKLEARWKRDQVKATVVISHSGFWEAVDWVAVPLTNGNGTDLTTGINIYNSADQVGTSPNDRYNYVDIDGVNDIATELPAPIKMELVSYTTTGVGDATHLVFGHQIGYNGATLINTHVELENFSSDTSLTDYSDSTCNNGYYTTLPLTAATEGRVYYPFELSGYQGDHWKFFVRFASAPLADLKVKVRIRSDTNLEPLAETGWVYANGEMLVELGDLRLRPDQDTLPSSGTLTELSLQLVAYSATGGDVNLDTLYWIPLQGYIRLGTEDINIKGETIIYSEGLERQIYTKEAGSPYRIGNPFVDTGGSGIWLVQGCNQRIHHLAWCTIDHSSIINNYLTMKLWYKPRRTTL